MSMTAEEKAEIIAMLRQEMEQSEKQTMQSGTGAIDADFYMAESWSAKRLKQKDISAKERAHLWEELRLKRLASVCANCQFYRPLELVGIDEEMNLGICSDRLLETDAGWPTTNAFDSCERFDRITERGEKS